MLGDLVAASEKSAKNCGEQICSVAFAAERCIQAGGEFICNNPIPLQYVEFHELVFLM